MKFTELNIESTPEEFDRKLVSKKLDNLKDLQYLTNSEIINKIILKWQKDHPRNSQLETLINSVLQIHFYVTELQNEVHLLKIGYEENRNDKLRAIQRARKCEDKK